MSDWPVTVNSYTSGTLCDSSQYKADFEKLRNAVNSLHARYSTLCFSGVLQDTGPALSGTVNLNWHVLRKYHATLGISTPDERLVFAIYKVPTWAQAFRVRQFDVLNSSNQGGSGIVPSFLSGTMHLAIGIAHATTLGAFNASASAGEWTATTIKEFSGAYDNLGDMTLGFTGGYTGAATPVEDPPLLTDSTLSTVVLGGSYLAFYAEGGLNYSGSAAAATPNINFQCSAWLDAMVPIP